MSLPPCPQCASEYTYEDGGQYICPEYTYEDGGQYICPECAHEWNETESAADLAAQVRDANGAALQ
ncbi:alkylphosphonate utilization protein, partial [Neisseria gonorrhoeae]